MTVDKWTAARDVAADKKCQAAVVSPCVVGCRHFPKGCLESTAVFSVEKVEDCDSEEWSYYKSSLFFLFLLHQTAVRTNVHPNPEHARLQNQCVLGIVVVRRRREVLMGLKAKKLLD